MRHKTDSLLCVLAAGVLVTPLATWSAAETAGAPAGDRANAATTTAVEPAPMDSRDRRLDMDAPSQRAELKTALRSGQTPAEMRERLKMLGYQVTAINERDEDRIELEIVKGRSSHEVQIDLDATGRRALDVGVAPNLWRAPTTKAALAGKTVSAPDSTPDASDLGAR